MPVQEYLTVSFGFIFISPVLGCSVGLDSVIVTNGISSSSISASDAKGKVVTIVEIIKK